MLKLESILTDPCCVQVVQVLSSGDSVITKQAALVAFSELAQHHGKQKAVEILKPAPNLIALVRLLNSELGPLFLIAAKKWETAIVTDTIPCTVYLFGARFENMCMLLQLYSEPIISVLS